MTTDFECKTREIIVDNGNDLPVDFYIKLFERYPNTDKYWEKIEDPDIIEKDGKYYDSLRDQYTCKIISSTLYCLYLTEKINIGHEWEINTIYFRCFDKNNHVITFEPKAHNHYNLLTDKNCIELWKELRYPGVYTVPKYVDRLTCSPRDHSWKAKIDKDKIIAELSEIARGNQFVSGNYSVQLILQKKKSMDDIEEHKRNFMDKFLREISV